MPTKKRRLNVTLKKDVALYLKKLALRDDMPEATKAAQMIETAMEIEEDLYLSRIADDRFARTKKWISHEEFWSKLL
ncbi:MAG: hypothetical protein PHN33_02945 [Candidatus Peribacteraceae bacterium]|nr:hypothetical protein [Candidatus Peribacteraceae bacterium]